MRPALAGEILKLAWRAAWERKGRTIGAIVGVMIAFAALSYALLIGQTFREYTAHYFTSRLLLNQLIVTGTELTNADLGALSSIYGVEAVVPIASARGRVTVPGVAGSASASIYGVRETDLHYIVTPASMHEGEPVVRPGVALIGYYIAYDASTGQRRAAAGSVISVHAGRRSVSVVVSGVLESGMVGVLDTVRGVVLDMSTFRQLTGLATYSAAVLVLRDASVADRVGEEVRALYPSASVISPRAILQLINEYLASFQAFLGVLAGVSTVITSLWIYDTMSISVIQRTREIGILRAVGFKRRYVMVLFLGEALIIAAIGVAAGALLLALVQYISPYIFSVAGQSAGAGAAAGTLRPPHPPFRITSLAFDPALIAAVGALVAAVNLLGALVPAYRASRLDVAAALRHE